MGPPGGANARRGKRRSTVPPCAVGRSAGRSRDDPDRAHRLQSAQACMGRGREMHHTRALYTRVPCLSAPSARPSAGVHRPRCSFQHRFLLSPLADRLHVECDSGAVTSRRREESGRREARYTRDPVTWRGCFATGRMISFGSVSERSTQSAGRTAVAMDRVWVGRRADGEGFDYDKRR